MIRRKYAAPKYREIDESTYNCYYFDAETGNDDNSGDLDNPKKTLSEASKLIASAGENNPIKILLKGGVCFKGELIAGGYSPCEKTPVIICGYCDTDRKPVIDTETIGIRVKNGDIRIRNIEVTGAEALLGIYVEPSKAGACRNIVIEDCFVHDINFRWNRKERPEDIHPSNLDVETVTPRNKYDHRGSGGIVLWNKTDNIGPSWFENIYILRNRVERTARMAIYVTNRYGYQPGVDFGINKYVNDNIGYYPHKNVVVNDNFTYYAGGDGICVASCWDSFIEGNRSYYSNYLGRDGYWNVGLWFFACRRTVFQYNEAAYTFMRHNTCDSEGFDIDNASSDIIFQYNYAHHNEGGGLLLCNKRTMVIRHNEDGTAPLSLIGLPVQNLEWGKWGNNHIRYNVFVNNGHPENSERAAFINIAQRCSDVYIYNNICVMSGEIEGQRIISTEGYENSFGHTYQNNIFYSPKKTNGELYMELVSNPIFKNNLFYNIEDESIKRIAGNSLSYDPVINMPKDYFGIDKMLEFMPQNKKVFSDGFTFDALETDASDKV